MAAGGRPARGLALVAAVLALPGFAAGDAFTAQDGASWRAEDADAVPPRQTLVEADAGPPPMGGDDAEGKPLLDGSIPVFDPGEAVPFSLGVLRERLSSGFSLAADAKATMRDVNGGRMCVGATGLSPGGYEFKGQIDVETCGTMAKEQPNVRGFRWGREDYSFEKYASLSSDLGTAGAAPAGQPVQLDDLFPDPGNFTCLIYMSVATQQREVSEEDASKIPDYKVTALNARFMVEKHHSVHSSTAHKAYERSGGSFHLVEFRRPLEAKSHAGMKVCAQRLMLTGYYHPVIPDLWFCYTPDELVEECVREKQEFQSSGGMIICCATVFGLLIAYILRNQHEFALAGSWVVRFLVYQEMTLLTLSQSMSTSVDTFQTVLVVFGKAQLLLLPFDVCSYCRVCNYLRTFYLFILAFTPCLFFEWMAYHPAIILIASHKPMIIGLLGLLVEIIKNLVIAMSMNMNGSQERVFGVGQTTVYTPMTEASPKSARIWGQ